MKSVTIRINDDNAPELEVENVANEFEAMGILYVGIDGLLSGTFQPKQDEGIGQIGTITEKPSGNVP